LRRVGAAAPLRLATLDSAAPRPPPAETADWQKPVSLRNDALWSRQWGPLYTVLFPALKKIIPAKRINELGEQFEKEEDRLFGEEGFEKTVAQVAEIEKQLGIYDLSQFTAK